MEIDPDESDSRVAQKRMLERIVAIPATLYFPTSIVAELNEICKSPRYSPEQLIIEALKGQIDYWNEFYEHVMTLPVKPEDFVWPKDPVFCLACVATVHFIDSFTRCSHDSIAFGMVAARWKQWRIYFTDIHPTGIGPQRQPGIFSDSAPMAGYPKIYNIEMDPHEDLVVGGLFGWVSGPALKAVEEYLESVKKYPNPPAPNITRFGGG
jgi:hypothetical protein